MSNVKTSFCISLFTSCICLGVAGDSIAQPAVSSSIGRTEVGRAAVAEGRAGTITGRERFLRRNRRRTSFVGRDRSELSTFVGQQQATTTGEVRTALEGRQVQFQRNANIASQRTNESTRGIYEPQLTIRFDVRSIPAVTLGASLAESLNASSKLHRLGPLSVTIDAHPIGARTATLAGVVATDEDRRLAEAYLRFEPGVSEVVNRLTVAAPSKVGPP